MRFGGSTKILWSKVQVLDWSFGTDQPGIALRKVSHRSNLERDPGSGSYTCSLFGVCVSEIYNSTGPNPAQSNPLAAATLDTQPRYQQNYRLGSGE